MTSLKKIYTSLFDRNLPVRQRFFNIIFLCGVIIGAVSTLVCISINTSEMAIKLSASMIVVFPFFALLGALQTHNQDKIILVALIVINFFTFPALYLSGGAINCGIPSFMVIGIALTLFLVKGKPGIILTVAECIWVICIYFISYAHPEILAEIPAYSMSETGQRDFGYSAVFSNAAIVCIALGVIAKILFRMYKTESKRVKEAINQVKIQAIIDPLTGLYNRRYMYSCLTEQLNISIRKSTPLSVAIFDIDHFKKLNDNYGHLLGDEVLKEVSCIIKSSCKGEETAARYGGEEFLLILPNHNLEQATERAEEIRKTIEATHLAPDLPEGEVVTISGGVAELSFGLNEETLVNLADENLYMAKNSGRNIICNSGQTEVGHE